MLGWIQVGGWVLSLIVNDVSLAYTCAIAAVAFFGIAECKKEGK